MTGKKKSAVATNAQPAPAPCSPSAQKETRGAVSGGRGEVEAEKRSERHPISWFVLLLALAVGLAIGGLGARYILKDSATRSYDALKQQLSSELMIARADLVKAQAYADALSGSLLVEQSTRKGVESSLDAAQAELGRTREQLAFFDQLFPPGPKGVLSIRALAAEQHGDRLQYRALLMRNAVNAPKFEGQMQFVAKGIQNGKPVSLVLEPARGLPSDGAAQTSSVDEKPDTTDAAQRQKVDEETFALQFDEFQRSVGMLQLPEGFLPTKLTLNVLEEGAVRAARTISVSAEE